VAQPTLWRHVRYVLTALESVQTRTFINKLRDAKVAYLEDFLFNENVVWLDVSMDQLLVYRAHSLRNVNHHLKGSGQWNLRACLFLCAQLLRQSPTRNIFHAHVRSQVGVRTLVYMQHSHDIWMIDLLGCID